MSIKAVVDAFKKLSLTEKLQAAEAIAREAEKAKSERAGQLLAELKGLGLDKGMSGRKVAPKYRSLQNPSNTWAGRGQMPNWLKAEMKTGKKKLSYFEIR